MVMCFDETVAWMFGESHTASPACMCPVLASIGMRLNDKFDDEERQLLIPLLARCGGTRSDPEVMQRRALVMLNASIREIGAMALEDHPDLDLSERLRKIRPVVDWEAAVSGARVAQYVWVEAKRRVAYISLSTASSATALVAGYAYEARYTPDVCLSAVHAAGAAAGAAYAYAATVDCSRRPIVIAIIDAFERAIEVR